MSQLFAPIKLADLDIPNRIVVAPMCQYSAEDGCLTDWHTSHLGMLANSGAGLLVIEATHVERHGRITHGCSGLYSDANEAAMQNYLSALDQWVTVIQGTIFVVCVLLFRRGIVGEIAALLRIKL